MQTWCYLCESRRNLVLVWIQAAKMWACHHCQQRWGLQLVKAKPTKGVKA